MSNTLKLGMGGGYGIAASSISEAEAAVLEVPGLTARFSARDLEPTSRELAYRDGVSGKLWRSLGGASHGQVGTPSRPAVRCDANARSMLVGDGIVLPASYSIYALVYPNANTNWHTIASHKDGAAGSFWLFSNSARQVSLAHGSTGNYEIISGGQYTSAQPYVVAANYDFETGVGAIGINTLSLTSGPLVAHSGALNMSIGGRLSNGVGQAAMNGWIRELSVFRGSHAVLGREDDLAANVTYLAELAGIAL